MLFINKLDPRTKIIFGIFLTILVFLVDKLQISVCLILVFFLLFILLKIPIRVFYHLKSLTMLVIFLIFIQAFFGPGKEYIVKPLFPPQFPLLGGYGSLKWDGLFLGLTLSCRLFSLMMILPALTETTPSGEIAAGLAAFGINYRAAFVITTAINLIPLFQEEVRAIIDAQKLRGISCFEKGSFFSKLKAYPGLVVPLVLGAMRKAQLASVSMDSRAFGVYKKRTWLDKPVMKLRDFLTIIFGAVFFTGILLTNYLIF
jgi:energy-coupling factor transport system permease protein